MATPGRVPPARLPPDRDLRDLRRDRRRRTAARAVGRRDGERARDRRQHGVGAVRLPRRRDRDEADPPGVGGARGADRRAARVARRGGPARRARGALRPLPRVRRHADRPRAAARRPRRALGDAPDRVQGLPGLPLHPRLARRDRVAPRRARPGRDRGRPRLDPRGGRLARARAGRHEGRAAHRLRGEVLAPVLDRGDARARPRRPGHLHRRTRWATSGCSSWPARCATRRASTTSYPAAFPGGVRITLARRADARGRPALPARRAREPDDAPTRCGRSSARTPRSQAGRSTALEEAILDARDPRRRARRPLAAQRGRRSRHDRRGRPAGGRRVRPRVGRARGLPGRVRLRARGRVPGSRSSRT